MADEVWLTDEDRMINRLKAHRDMITWIIRKLKEEGIPCERTINNDSSGDILYYHDEHEERVKEIIREMNSKFNQI